MIHHSALTDNDIRKLIRSGDIALAGNSKDKIFGLLKCFSGKRMKKENRVFFKSVDEALQHTYRPCGHCMPDAYRNWKSKR